MVRVTIFFVAGIVTAIHYQSVGDRIVVAAAGVATLVFVTGLLLRSKIVTGVSGLVIVFLLGYLQAFDRGRQECPLETLGEIDMYQAVVSRFAEERARTFRTEVTIQAVHTVQGWQTSCGTMLVYFPKDLRQYRYGDVLLVKGTPRAIPPPANPGEFDFRQFLEYRRIYYQDFLRDENVTWLAHRPPNLIIYHAISVRQWADVKIRAVVDGEREQATATALVLGVTDGLDSELLQAYSSTGALHVLAVSGLHVSIIYWILLLVLKPLDRKGPPRWMLAIISVVFLWMYAFVTGWSPSVLRAVMMFTFVAFSRPWRQSTNIYNTLASSMFCLLLYDPFFIMSVGFQLSYLAVFGIVFLQPRLYAIWEPDNRLIDEIWKVSSVSVAAQIATLPIALFYFHQFPNYFLPANLVVIPVSFVVLVTGLAVTAFAFFDPLCQMLGFLLTWSIKLMNYLVLLFGGLPFSVIDGIYIEGTQAIVLALFIAALTLLFIQKKFGWLIVAMMSVTIFSAMQWHHFATDVRARTVRVYSVAGRSMIDMICDGDSRMVLDSLAGTQWDRSFRFIQPSWIRGGVSLDVAKLHNVQSRDGWTAWVWGDISFLRVSDNVSNPPEAEVTFLVISNNSVKSLTSLAGVKCEKIIVDSSNSFYFAERLRNEAIALGVELWSVPHAGAFEYKPCRTSTSQYQTGSASSH